MRLKVNFKRLPKGEWPIGFTIYCATPIRKATVPFRLSVTLIRYEVSISVRNQVPPFIGELVSRSRWRWPKGDGYNGKWSKIDGKWIRSGQPHAARG